MNDIGFWMSSTISMILSTLWLIAVCSFQYVTVCISLSNTIILSLCNANKYKVNNDANSVAERTSCIKHFNKSLLQSMKKTEGPISTTNIMIQWCEVYKVPRHHIESQRANINFRVNDTETCWIGVWTRAAELARRGACGLGSSRQAITMRRLSQVQQTKLLSSFLSVRAPIVLLLRNICGTWYLYLPTAKRRSIR